MQVFKKIPISAFFILLCFGVVNSALSHQRDYVELIKKVKPAVVNIDIHSKKRDSQGSGFVVHDSGVIVTNHHVIDGADEISVKFDNGNFFSATLYDSFESPDLAVIYIDDENAEGINFQSLPFGDSDTIEVGEHVLVIGNPKGLGGTVTAGIISAKERFIDNEYYHNFIQTDASINPGNSGGPLINLKGEVIGINTFIATEGGGSEGLGFAIPANEADKVITSIVKIGNGEHDEWLENTKSFLSSVADDGVFDVLGMKLLTAKEYIRWARSKGDSSESIYRYKKYGGLVVLEIEKNSPANNSVIKIGTQLLRAAEIELEKPVDLHKAIANVKLRGLEKVKLLTHDGEDGGWHIFLNIRE